MCQCPGFPNLRTPGVPCKSFQSFLFSAALALAIVGLLGLSLVLGSAHVAPAEVWRALFSAESSLARDVVVDLRLPRALTAFGVGGLLALAGALLQVLLRNPLADPYVLGVSGRRIRDRLARIDARHAGAASWTAPRA